MAIAKKSVTTGTNNGGTKTVTCVTSESPSATAVGDLVVVIYGNNFYTLAAMGTPSATGTPTMTHIVTADAGSNLAHIKAYWYVANTAGAQTISATETGDGDEEKYITTYVLSGANTTAPTDGSASNFSATAATPHTAPAVSPATSDAFVIAETNTGGGGSTASYTTPSPLTEDGEIHVGGLAGVYGSAQLSASGSTGAFNFTPLDSRPYAAVTIAIKTAGGGGTPNQGSAAGTLTRAGSATGARVSSGGATGGLTRAGTTTGTTVHRGATTGTVARVGVATGTAPLLVQSGAATGTILRAGTATGARTSAGSAVGTIARAGAATGLAPSVDGASGAAVGTIARAGVVTGSRPSIGGAVGTLLRTGASIGATIYLGSAAGTITRVGTAAGHPAFDTPVATPPERTYAVPAESRVTVVGAQSRVTAVPAESRTTEV